MIRATQVVLLVLLVALLGGACVWGLVGWDLHKLATGVTPQASLLLQRWTPGKGKPDALIDAAYNFLHAGSGAVAQIGDAARAAGRDVDATSANVNRPCKGPAGPDACGILAGANKVLAKAGDAVVTTQTAELQAVPHATRAMDAFADAAYSLDDASRSGETALDSFNDLLQSKDISEGLNHANGTLASVDAIGVDARRVVDKATTEWLKPVPWWKQPIKKSSDLLDIGAAVARHTP